MKKSECESTCCEDEDCPCSKKCSDERYCDKHEDEEAKNYGTRTTWKS